MDDRQSHRRFCTAFAAALLATCGAAALVNGLVDPYLLLGSQRRPGFNDLKPKAAHRIRTSKPYLAEGFRAATLVGGNSRPEMGLDPGSPGWRPESRPVFNMGVPGATLQMQAKYLRHGVYATGARRVVLALDYVDFLVPGSEEARARSRAAAAEILRLELDPDGRTGFQQHLQRGKDRLAALFSLETLLDSAATVLAQGDPESSTRNPDGFNPARDYLPIIRSEGQRILFDQRTRELAASFARNEVRLSNRDDEDDTPLPALARFLDWAASADVEVVLAINPYHAYYLCLIHATGTWDRFEAWKREMSDLAASKGVPLWDFNDFGEWSVEAPPGPGDTKTVLRWYWEPGHYRSSLGELMIARLEDAGAAGVPGARISPANIESHLDDLRSGRDGFIAARRSEYDALRALVPESP